MAELCYQAWGETRYTWGATPTDYRFTGQREEGALGLYFNNARWYDPALGRFIQADTLVTEPGNPQSWDRYAYVDNNPVLFTDPSGHWLCEGDKYCSFDKKNIVSPRRIPLTPGGAQAYKLFINLRTYRGDEGKPGWWNADGGFNLVDYLGLWILHEAGGDSEKAGLLAQVVAQNLYVGGYNLP